MKKPLVTARNIDFSFGERQVLKGVDLDLYPNEFLAIAGPNGGGKTTLLKLLLGLFQPLKGRIELLGKSPVTSRGNIGYVPQINTANSSFPLSLFDVVLMGRLRFQPWGFRTKEVDRSAAEKALTQVDLLSLAHHPFHHLSGGQAQRGLIARAICAQAQILLLDEPTAHIDPENQAKILDCLCCLKKEMAIAMVSHDWQAINKCADRVVYVQQKLEPMNKETICDHFRLGLYHTPKNPKSKKNG